MDFAEKLQFAKKYGAGTIPFPDSASFLLEILYSQWHPGQPPQFPPQPPHFPFFLSFRRLRTARTTTSRTTMPTINVARFIISSPNTNSPMRFRRLPPLRFDCDGSDRLICSISPVLLYRFRSTFTGSALPVPFHFHWLCFTDSISALFPL